MHQDEDCHLHPYANRHNDRVDSDGRPFLGRHALFCRLAHRIQDRHEEALRGQKRASYQCRSVPVVLPMERSFRQAMH